MFEIVMTMDADAVRAELWSGGAVNAGKLTSCEFSEVLEILIDELRYNQNPTITEINDTFWFEFDWVCELIGLKYDCETDKILR